MILPKAIPGSRDLVSPSKHNLDQVKIDLGEFALDVQDRMVSLQPSWAQIGP